MSRAGTREPVRVLLVEDQAAFRAAIASEFESDPAFELVGEAGSLAAAREMLETADVVILDLGLPDGSGAELIPELRTMNPQAKAIVLSTSVDPDQRSRALELGAALVLDKLAHLGRIVHAARRIVARDH